MLYTNFKHLCIDKCILYLEHVYKEIVGNLIKP